MRAPCQGQDDKIRVVLNKADAVSPQQLMRVYGAMMWSLGKVIRTPEVVRVYVGSFWDEPYKNKDNEKLFQAEQGDLIRDLRNLPANSTVRKVNEIVKRARLLRVHAHIIGYLKNQMPSLFGKQGKQDELINNMREVFQAVQRQYNLPMGDFPDVDRFKENCSRFDFSKHFVKLSPKVMQDMDTVLSVDLPELMKRFPQDQPSKHLTDLMSKSRRREASWRRQASRRLTAARPCTCRGWAPRLLAPVRVCGNRRRPRRPGGTAAAGRVGGPDAGADARRDACRLDRCLCGQRCAAGKVPCQLQRGRPDGRKAHGRAGRRARRWRARRARRAYTGT